jgi:hypothetical protein
MKKLLTIFATLITLFAVVPNALALTKAFQVNTASGGSLTTGLVSYYNMQGNSNDYWGTNNGTDTSVSYGTSYGKVAQGALFAATSKISIPSQTVFNLQSSFSIFAWVYQTSRGNGSYYVENIIAKDNFVAGNRAFQFDVRGPADASNVGKIRFTYNVPIDASVISVGIISLNAWHYVGIISTAGTYTFYIDGSVDSTGSTNITPVVTGTAPLTFGAGGTSDGANETMQGNIDEVGVWSKALSTQEISDLYNSGSGQTMCNGTGGPLCGKHKVILISLNWKPEPIA